MKFFRGYRPDPEEVRKRRPGFHILRARLKLERIGIPLKVDLSAHVTGQGGPGILNQLQTSACTGHAVAGAITTRMSVMQSPIKRASPICPYTLGRAIGRQPNPDGSLPPLTDEGAEPSQVARGVSEWGIVSATTWGDYPADPSTINKEPTFDKLEEAADFKLEGAYFLQSSGTQMLLDLMTALSAGFPVTNSVEADTDEFQGYTGGILGPQGTNLDHYTYCVGSEWDGKDPMTMVGTFANSWGPTPDVVPGDTGWGENGFYRMNAAGILQMQDLCVFDVSPAPGDTGEQ